MQIRTATDDDGRLLVDIIRCAFLDVAKRFGLTPENCLTHPSNYTLERIRNDFGKGITYYLAALNGQALGCVALERPDQSTFYLERLAVLPEARRQGIGKTLVQHVFRVAADDGAKAISIAIIAQHVDLQRWYEALGFGPVETKHFADLPFAVTFMKCEIGNANHRLERTGYRRPLSGEVRHDYE